MALAKCSDSEFIELWNKGGASLVSDTIGITHDNAYKRRRRLESKIGRPIHAPTSSRPTDHPQRVQLDIPDGVVLVGSDGHYWPGEPSTAHRAFVHFARHLQPRALIMNGDAFDGATISRHPSIGWEDKPSVIHELEAVQERLHEIELAVPRECALTWPLGNHDARFETRLANTVPEFAKVNGVHLKDHVSQRWQPCWSTWINDSVVVKHRLKGGIHATHNNTMWAGKTVVTGHLHSLKVTPFTDYGGTRWGVDCGCLADPDHRAFTDYTEDAPKNWRSGFVVLTFRECRLLPPETVMVWGHREVVFRGHVIPV